MMQRFFITFIFAVMAAVAVTAQGVLVSCAKPMHDFGIIEESAGKVTHIFQIKNSGKSPLAITHVATSCGCTATNWSKEPILPGKTGDISVTFDPKERPGKFFKSVTVYCTGMKRGLDLRIRGTVNPEKKN